jgi:peptidoglycan/xylan/chitin deacetylase (PgdA/CDA1 family)
MYHDIAPQEQDRFAAQLQWLAQSWTFISPLQFAAMVRGDAPIKGANLLLSFDDGFESNRRVAEEILNPMGISALFFVVPAFVDLVDVEGSRAFITHHICPALTTETVPANMRNMTWDDLRYLIDTGHTIGAHTATHARLSELLQPDKLVAEIIDSANALERNLCFKIEHFAYPFGNLDSFSPAALAMARRRFSFIYTALRGDNACGAPLWALRREGAAPSNSFGLLGALLEGGADLHYAREIAQYECWGSGSK